MPFPSRVVRVPLPRRRTSAAVCAVVAVLLLAPGSAGTHTSAGEAPTTTSAATLLDRLTWRNIGPNRGGRSIAVAGSASRPFEYYFGATGGGLWKTVDGGQSWAPVGDDCFETSSVGAIAVSESNPDVVYVGMGETALRGNVIQGDGVYKSTDGGRTWAHVGLERTSAIARIRVHPADPDRVYVAALGDPYAPGADRGIHRSTDGGRTWQRVLFRDERTGAIDLSLDPTTPDVLYAGLWEVYRTPHSLSSGGPGSGLFKSIDGGSTWTELTGNAGLPPGVWGKVGVSVSPADPRRVYAIVESAAGGVFVSDDAGTSWRLANDERRLRQRAFYYTRIYADPKDRDTVFVLNSALYRSTNGGKSYTAVRVPHGDTHDLWIAPNDSRRMINSNDGGANVSVTGGETWTEQDVPTAQFYGVVTTKHLPYHVCGAQQDNTTACVSSQGSGDVLYAVGGGESGYVAADPTDPNVFYAGSYGGLLTRFDRATGQNRHVSPWPENPMGHASRDIAERFQWTFPIVFHPLDPGVLFVGSQHVWKTTDGGQSWKRISPDLTRADPATLGPSGGPITLDQSGVETYATVFTIAPSRREKEVIWAGSDDGLVHVTRDGGGSWTKVTPADLPEFARISLIEASPHAAGTAYLAANRYQLGDRRPYVYRTDDYGRTWTRIVSGIPAGDFARVVREDNRRPGLLYLGTEHGIHVSFDRGDTWQSLRSNLPVSPVHGILVEENDLVIATHGRSFWVLPNIGVLRQLTPAVTASDVHLFKPSDLVRYRITPLAALWRGTAGVGSRLPTLPIDYYLKAAAKEVTLEIRDAAGRVVRSFTARAPVRVPQPRPVEDDQQPFAHEHDQLGVGRGLNRFAWDLRYEGASGFPGLVLWAATLRGPIAPPGTYQVSVTADGKTSTQPFRIVRDPRVTNVTDADLQAQFGLASEIRDAVSLANGTVSRIRRLKSQLEDRAARAAQPELATAARELARRLTEIEGEIHQYRIRSSQDPLTYPIKVNNTLAALQATIEAADARPTDQDYAMFRRLSATLTALVQQLDAVVSTEVTTFNRLASAGKLPPVTDDTPAPHGAVRVR